MKKNALYLFVISSMLLGNSVSAGEMGPTNVASNEWTGFYFGGNIGGSWADPSVDVATVNSFNNTVALTPSGLTYAPAAAIASSGSLPLSNSQVLGGLQLGYNYQIMNNFVAGFEADIQSLDSKKSRRLVQITPRIGTPNTVTGSIQASQKTSYIGTVRGRLGVFVPHFNSWLAYFTGGLAYGGIQSSTLINGGETPNTGSTDYSGFGHISTTRTGYTLGGGIEKYVASQWSLKVEYLYYDLGTVSYSNGSLTSNLNNTSIITFINNSSSSIRFNGNIVRAGLNFHFS